MFVMMAQHVHIILHTNKSQQLVTWDVSNRFVQHTVHSCMGKLHHCCHAPSLLNPSAVLQKVNCSPVGIDNLVLGLGM